MTTATIPAVRGKLTAKAPLAPLVWFKSGGPATGCSSPRTPTISPISCAISIPPCR